MIVRWLGTATSPSPARPRPSRRIIARLFLAALAPGVALLILEGLLRVTGIGAAPSIYRLAHHESGELVYETNIPEYGRGFATFLELNPSPARFRAVKDKGSRRLFVVGDSTVFGTGYAPLYSLPKWVQIRLETLLPGEQIEVINAGTPGIDSRNLVRIVQHVLRYEPDAIVAYSGHNELLEPHLYALRHPWEWWARELISRWNLLRVIRRLIYGETVPKMSAPPSPRGEGPIFDEPVVMFSERDAACRAFGEHLRRIASLCRGAGVPLVLCTPASRLRDYPPVQASFRSAPPPAVREHVRATFERARSLIAAEAWSDALSCLDEITTIDDGISLVRYLRGRCLERLGRTQEARIDLLAAAELDGSPNRASSPFIEMVRRVAAEEEVPLADVAAALAEGSPLGFPDETFFFDSCHPNMRGQCVMAGVIVRTLGENGILFASDRWNWSREPSVEDYLAAHPMSAEAAALAYHARSLANFRRWLMSISTGEELAIALENARTACELDPANLRYRGTFGLLQCLGGQSAEGRERLAAVTRDDPQALADLARLATASPRLGQIVSAAGLRVEGGCFLPAE
ncbi:MAG: SGNH/GDSL hydrolase family protein [Planctomycetota bacterium]